MNASWIPIGRIALWVHAIGYVVASLVFIGVVFAITAPAAPAASASTADGAAAVLAYRSAIWPQILLSWLVYFIAFTALVPIAYLLREILGGDARAQLAAMFVGLGVVGIIDSLLTLSAWPPRRRSYARTSS